METTTPKKGRKKIVDDQSIISLFMDSVLKNDAEPKNVYLFCQEAGIKESDFYIHFGSIEALKEAIWTQFFEHAVATMQKDEAYNAFVDRDKLLTLYFTLFELLSLNRSYVLFQLEGHKQGLKNLKSLRGMRNHFKDFIFDNVQFTQDTAWNEKWAKISKSVSAEAAWLNFLVILKFWIEDTSKGFEKTDILIEKTVNTAFDLMQTQPLERVVDLGKFLWKENHK
ncbi:TetR/AcrR family transcriptional regulator [Flavobacterium sp.]|uniref:TetR/AcrR family transcriptional regulator n=1 Tax=Flavobacterium sp. TaxID=239 RepID=UPI00334108DA